MKRKLLVVALLLATLSSCSTVVNQLNIESIKEAKYPVNFENNSIALFLSLDKESSLEWQKGRGDSTLMSTTALAIATELEESLNLERGAIYIYNHYPAVEGDYQLEYLQELSYISNSDLLMVVDQLNFGKPQILGSYLLTLPTLLNLKIYDGTAGTQLANISQRDTVYWELFTRSDLSESSIESLVNRSSTEITNHIAKRLVDNLFPSWVEQQRTLFNFSKRGWSKALSYAEQFKWEEAMEIWMEISQKESSPTHIAAAAFNMAVACELTGRVELAKEWLEVAYKSYPNLPHLASYQRFIEDKIEKK